MGDDINRFYLMQVIIKKTWKHVNRVMEANNYLINLSYEFCRQCCESVECNNEVSTRKIKHLSTFEMT